MLAVAALFFASACGDDDGDDDGPMMDPIVGSYTMSQVTLNSDLDYAGQTLPAGSDITIIVEGLLFLESPCDDPSNTIIILDADMGLAYGCQNESVTPVDFGTWLRDETTNSLTLFITIAGNDVPLRITDLRETSTSIAGTIPSLLLPNAPGFEPPLVTANVDIVFDRVD